MAKGAAGVLNWLSCVSLIPSKTWCLHLAALHLKASECLIVSALQARDGLGSD